MRNNLKTILRFFFCGVAAYSVHRAGVVQKDGIITALILVVAMSLIINLVFFTIANAKK